MAWSANATEIKSLLSSGILTTLQNDGNESLSATGAINGFISDSQQILVGEMWDIERQKLQKYNELLTERATVESQLQEAISEAVQLVIDYLGEDDDLDSAKLPEFKKNAKQLKKQIKNLNSMMLKVKLVDKYDDDGKFIESHYEPVYDKNDLQSQIDALQAELDETTRLIEKTEGLEAVLKQAEALLDQVYSQLRRYENDIDNLEKSSNIWSTIAVGGINLLGGVAKSFENVIDGAAWTAAGAVFTIGDWLGVDTNSARKRLASAIGTDVVGGAMSTLFEETRWGSSLNAGSYYSYDRMNDIYNLGNHAVSLVAEAILPTPLAVAFGAMHNAGAKAEEFYSSNPDALGGIGGDYGWRIAASGVEGGINAYLVNNATEEVRNVVSHGFGHYSPDTGIVRPYRDIADFVRTNSRDILVETGIDAVSNVMGDVADKGQDMTLSDVAWDIGQAMLEQTAAVAHGSPAGAQTLSPFLDYMQGAEWDDKFWGLIDTFVGR